MKHVGPARAELGFRTIFNLLGPLSNPAGVSATCSASSRPTGSSRSPNVLATLGAERAWVVHGAGGFDEISPAGETKVAALEERRGHGLHRHARPTPASPSSPAEAIKGGDAGAQRRGAPRRARRRSRAPIATPCSSMPAPRWSSPARPTTSPRASRSPPPSIDERQGAERARPAGRGLERREPAMTDILKQDRSLQARRDRRRQGRRPAGRDRRAARRPRRRRAASSRASKRPSPTAAPR